MATWIVSAGAEGRDYTEYFFRFGMAFVGGEGQRASMKQVRAGDTILLKRGLSEFVAAGQVVERNGIASGDGDKEWLRDFDGWDLAGYCYVDWHIPAQADPATGLRMGTIYQTNRPEHLAAVQRLLMAPLCPAVGEPGKTAEVKDDAILSFLIAQGLRVSAADELTEALPRTFLVVPLLLALGWAEQQLKIELPAEGGRVDIACFRGSFKSGYNEAYDEAVVLIETKGFSSGLDYAPKQAQAYANHFKNCQVVLVTNGYCYKTYLRQTDATFSTKPSAYLNIVKPRDKYPLDPEHVAGALEVLRWLMPTTLHKTMLK